MNQSPRWLVYLKGDTTMSKSKEFSMKTLENHGYYVYVYSDPDTKKPFYIGKGKGNRCFAHLYDSKESDKVSKIQKKWR